MGSYFSIILAFSLLPIQMYCQTVQDDWTAPAAPDGSTSLQTGTRFTVVWKSGLQNSFKTYCTSCDIKKLDLWITNFNGTKYTSKIGRGIDLTTTSSYDWNVNIASNAFSDRSFWVFRFTFFDSVDPYAEQISSPGFKIAGFLKASSTMVPQSSSAPSVISTSMTVISTQSSGSESTQQPPSPSSASNKKALIPGVVVGSVVGIALGAGSMWYCLGKRQNKKAEKIQGDRDRDDAQNYPQKVAEQIPENEHPELTASNYQPWQR
ncbi:hypothetical protein BDU57DRAFT_493006, partial [Ampelomyces quisqualis]